MGKMPWTRSRSNGSRLQTGLMSRRRSRRLKKRVRFQKESHATTSPNYTKCTAARSLFSTKTIVDLPDEMITNIITYFDAKELMNLRCIDRTFMNIVDHSNTIWSKVSYRNMWPSSLEEKALFQRGANANNIESLTKLGLDHLYHYNLSVGEEKNKKEVKMHSVMAATYLRNLDVHISPNKPITWMLIRPPWSSSRSICLKHLVHKQMLKSKSIFPDGSVSYNLGRVFSLDTDEHDNSSKVIQNFKESSKLNCSHAKYELLVSKKHETYCDAGTKLQWLRELRECALSGNKDALYEFVQNTVAEKSIDLKKSLKVAELSKALFRDCNHSRIDKLEQYQPKINSLMRCILIDWLAEVAYMKDMSHQVLHAAVNYVDHFLMTRVVERTKLQLLGISCLLLAAKSHYDTRQVHILTVRESSWLTDQTYQYEDVVKMMGEIIGNFRGDLWLTTSWNYLNILHCSQEIDEQWKLYSHYLHDMSLQFTSFGSYKPSYIAAATLLLAGLTLNKDEPWPSSLVEMTGMNMKDIVNCASLIHYKCFTCPSMKDDRNLPLESIRERYSNDRNMRVAKLDALTDGELKSRILSADSSLSCASQEPLHFVVVPLDFDETFNFSIKSVDYDGDSEASLDSESDFDESFCVGRNRLSSYHSVEEFSDDETTMDAEAHFNQNRRNKEQYALPKENFTPIFHGAKNENNVFFDRGNNELGASAAVSSFIRVVCNPSEDASIEIPLEKDIPSCSSAHAVMPKNDRTKRVVNDFQRKRRVKKRKHKMTSLRSDPVGKRTRSSSLHK